LNREKNSGQKNWFRKNRIGPAASTNQIRPFSYWLCESRTGPDCLALFSGIVVFQFLIQVKLNLKYSI